MIYMICALTSLGIAVITASILALKYKIPSNSSLTVVTDNLDNSDVELSKALEHVKRCNGVMEGYDKE